MPENVNTSALSDTTIAPDDHRKTMIKVDHVSMVFNMASEQLNSLKEYVIKIARRELFFEGFTALDDVSIEVKKGDVFGIIGTNGSGKSTMLKIIAGVLEPSKGVCEISGSIAPLIELGAGFDEELTARENIYLNGALLGYSREFIKEHFDEIVAFAEIEKFLDMPLKNYSSGMVARIAFAIATVIVPDILVVDEVLSVGDFMFQKKCEDRINELIEKHNVTVLIVSHSNAQIERLCNKVIWIEKGHTRMMGDAASVCRVYGGLGGRTGSAEAEQRVLEALLMSGEQENLDELCETIVGENADSTNAKVALRGWEDEAIDTVVIACDNTHINAVMANALASAFNAPVLTSKPDSLPDAVERVLYDAKPTTVFTIDCETQAQAAFDQLEKLPWKPHIVRFQSDGDVHDLSWRIFAFGQDKGLWGNEAVVIDFDDNPESLAASPYLYAHRCPTIVVPSDQEKDRLTRPIVDRLAKNGIMRVLVLGATAVPSMELEATSAGIEVVRIAGATTVETCLNISELAFTHPTHTRTSATRKLCIASLSLAQWPELLSCGSYAGKRGSALLLLDQTNLDSIEACLDFVSRHRTEISSLVSVGEQLGLGKTECELLCAELTKHRGSGEKPAGK